MHSFALINSATSQALQAAPHPSQGASRAWSANTTQQYTTGNTGVQQSQTNFSSQNGANPSRHMANRQNSDNSHLAAQSKNASDNFFLQLLLSQPQYKLNQLQNENIPALTTAVSQSAPMQYSNQHVANQSLSNSTVTNATYAQQNMLALCKQPVSFNEANSNTYSSHIQQSWTQQAMRPAADGGMTGTVSSYNAGPSLPYNQMVNANTTLTAPVQNGQNLVAPNQIHGQSFSNVGYFQNYTSNCRMATSQSFRNINVATQRTSPDAQVVYASKNGQINWQPSPQYNASNKNSGGFINISSLNQSKRNYVVIKPNEHPLNNDSTIQQLPGQNLHTDVMSKLFPDCAKPPSYESHQYTTLFRMSNQNVQTATVARSESHNFKAKSVMSIAQQIVGASLQQGSLPILLDVNTSGNRAESGRLATINKTATKRCSVDSMSDSSQGCERMLLQRGEPQAVVLSQSNKNIGMLSPFKQKDSCAPSMSGHTGIRAVAVVPPLSQEEHHSPVTAEPCKSVDDVEKRGISPNVTDSIETAAVKELSNRNPVTTNKRAFNVYVAQTISESEPKSLAQTSKQGNHESDVQRLSDVLVSQNGSGKPTEGTAPQLLTVYELSMLPTKSWKAEHLAKLILEMDKAQPKPNDAPESPNIVKIVMTMWNKNIPAMLRSYKETLSSNFFSEIEQFCETHIKEDTSIVTEVSPDFKDQLKLYTILNDHDVYSEPPYKSLWFNVNNKLDDIDKDFGFPWTLRRHLYVDETKSPGQDFQTIENVPEKAVNDTVNKVLPLAGSDSVDMTEENEAPENLTASPQESTEKKSCESSYSFKIEVLPPEEAKVIFEQIKQNDEHNSNIEKETSVSGSEQREGSDKMDSTTAPKQRKSSDNQLEEICCLARFIEMNSGLGKPSSQCQCRDKQNENKDTIKIFESDPEQLLSGQTIVGCQTATVKGVKLSSQIIDLTDDSDDRLFSIFDKEPEPIFQTCSQTNAADVSTYKDGELSADFSSSNEMHDLVFREGTSEDKHVQEELASTGTVSSSGSVCCTQVRKLDPSNSIKTKELILFFNQKENCEQPPATSNDQAVSPSENKAQTSLSLCINNERSGKKEKRQSSIHHYFQSLKKPKKRRRLVATDPDHTSEAQHSASTGKRVELVLFGSGQQVACSPFEKEKARSSSQSAFFEKDRPPGVLSVKLDSLERNITTANPTRKYSAKEVIYDKWRRSVPAVIGSVAFCHKSKLKRRAGLPALISCRNTQEETWTVSPETSDRTKKHILSLKKRRALKEGRRLEEMKRKRYSVAFEQPEGQKASETNDDKSLHNGIVLKFSLLPNTFNLTDGSAWTEEAPEPFSDQLKPVEEKRLIKAAKKPKGTWYHSQAKQFEPLHISKNASLFHEYQKKYKEKTGTSTNE